MYIYMYFLISLEVVDIKDAKFKPTHAEAVERASLKMFRIGRIVIDAGLKVFFCVLSNVPLQTRSAKAHGILFDHILD